MKKLILLSLLCLATNTLLRGQIAKGTITLGGEIGFGYVFAESAAWTGQDFTIAPSFGLMVTDHWMVSTSFSTGINGSSALFSPEVRYYLNPGNKRNNYYVGIGILLPLLNWADESIFDFQFGFNRFLNENIAFDANVTYAVYSQTPSALSLNLGLQPFMSRGDRDSLSSAASTFNRGDLLFNPSFAALSVYGPFHHRIIEAAFDPDFGLFLNNNTLVGFSLSGYVLTSLSDKSDYRYVQHIHLSLSPYLRHYLGSEQRHWRWYGQLCFALSSSSNESNAYEVDWKGLVLSNRWGANWFLTPNLAFDIGLDLSYNPGTDADGFRYFQTFDGPLGDRGFRVGTSIGVQYFLQRGN